jgi:hypothetical protein
MATNKEKTYWPHMILGFLAIGLTLSYWTVKSALSLPVQESNQYMLKYQMADININQILEAKARFDKDYRIEILNAPVMVMTDNIHSKRPQANAIVLHKGRNTFAYAITDKEGKNISDANVTFLLTQPHSRKQDQLFTDIAFREGAYHINEVNIEKAGRYSLQFRAEIKNSMGYSELSAYLKP